MAVNGSSADAVDSTRALGGDRCVGCVGRVKLVELVELVRRIDAWGLGASAQRGVELNRDCSRHNRRAPNPSAQPTGTREDT